MVRERDGGRDTPPPLSLLNPLASPMTPPFILPAPPAPVFLSFTPPTPPFIFIVAHTTPPLPPPFSLRHPKHACVCLWLAHAVGARRAAAVCVCNKMEKRIDGMMKSARGEERMEREREGRRAVCIVFSLSPPRLARPERESGVCPGLWQSPRACPHPLPALAAPPVAPPQTNRTRPPAPSRIGRHKTRQRARPLPP